MKGLIVGAGVTGCYTAWRLAEKGVDVALLARGDKADRLKQDGLRLRNGMTAEETTAHLRILRPPVEEEFAYAMVCVQEPHRPSVEPLLGELPGRPTIWYLGNTTKGYERMGEQFGRDRVLGGFPSVGGTWEGDVLVYADREKPSHGPFDRLVIGEAFEEAAPAAAAIVSDLEAAGMKMERYVPIMAWHWSHIALILPLAAAVYRHDNDLEAVGADAALLRRTMRATSQAFTAVRRAGFPILPRALNVMRWLPAALGARKIASLLQSEFGRIALAAHMANARAEMRGFAQELLTLAGDGAGADLRKLAEAI